MTEKVRVNGLDLTLPKRPPKTQMINYGKKKADQFWERQPIPDFMEGCDPFNPTEEQNDFIAQELDRTINGVWVLINGEPTWVPGEYYFFLQWWRLQEGIYPDYRDVDRRFFIFWEICKSYNKCLGMCTGKYRRQGASSRGSSISIKIAITEENVRNGMVSKTGEDARSIFQDMIVFGFKSLPDFMKPQSSGSDKAVKELVIAHQAGRMTKDKRIASGSQGLNSSVSWRPTAINSYDSGRLRYVFVDEGGKYPKEVPFYRYWNILKRCLVIGARKIGMAYIPSTVNAMKDGGAEFKKLWDASDHLRKDFDGTTISGLFKFFVPCYDGYLGYIGKFGESIIDTPTPEQRAFLETNPDCPDPTIGAKEYHEQERKKLADDPDALVEYIRQNPFTEKEQFYEPATSQFIDNLKANKQVEAIDAILDQIPYRKGEFYRDLATKKVNFRDTETGPWTLLWNFDNPEIEANRYRMVYNKKTPVNQHLFSIGVDPVASSQGAAYGEGSKGVAWIKRSHNPADPNNSDMPIGRLCFRPKLKHLFHEQVFLAAEYFSCMAGYEDKIDDFFDYAIEEGFKNYMVKPPPELIGKRAKIEKYGIPTNSAKAMEFHCNILKADFYENHEKYWFQELLYDYMKFDPTDRTLYDDAMAWGFALITEHACKSHVSSSEEEEKKPVYVKTYNIIRSSR